MRGDHCSMKGLKYITGTRDQRPGVHSHLKTASPVAQPWVSLLATWFSLSSFPRWKSGTRWAWALFSIHAPLFKERTDPQIHGYGHARSKWFRKQHIKNYPIAFPTAVLKLTVWSFVPGAIFLGAQEKSVDSLCNKSNLELWIITSKSARVRAADQKRGKAVQDHKRKRICWCLPSSVHRSVLQPVPDSVVPAFYDNRPSKLVMPETEKEQMNHTGHCYRKSWLRP